MRLISLVTLFLFWGNLQAFGFTLISSTTIDGASSSFDGANGVAVGTNGYVYGIGTTVEPTGGLNIWLGQWGPNLVFQSTSVKGSGNGGDVGNGLGIHTTYGNGSDIWVTGAVTESQGGGNIWVAKYAPGLELLSSTTFNGTANADEEGYSVAFYQNEIFVVGFSSETGKRSDIWIGKISGSERSSVTVNGLSNADDAAYDIAIDSSTGHLYIIGSITEGDGGRNIWIAKYNSFLNRIASTTVNGSANLQDEGRGIAVDPLGNFIYAVGSVNESVGGQNIWIGKYDSTLAFISSKTVSGSNGTSETAMNVAVDTSGYVYAIGTINEQPLDSGQDIWLAQYDTNLTLVSSTVVVGPNTDSGNGIAVLGNSVYAVGAVKPVSGLENIWLARYAVSTQQQQQGYTTVPATPVLSTSSVNISSITWSWVAVSSATGYRLAMATSPYTYISDNLSTTTLSLTEVALATNTAYSRILKAINDIGVSTSAAKTVYTLAALPTNLAAVAYISSASVSWLANTNPSSTTSYRLSYWSSGSTTTAQTTNTSYGLTGLSEGTTYYFALRAINGDGILTDYTSTISTVTQRVPVPVLSVSPTSIDLGALDPGTQKQSQFTITNSANGTLSGTISSSEGWLTLSHSSFESNSLTVTVTADNNVLNATSGSFSANVTITSNGGNSTVTVSVSPTCSIAFPNPFNADGSNQITFAGTGVPYSELHIFTVSGEHIQTFQETQGKDRITWDGRNTQGDLVTTGIYLYYTKNPNEIFKGQFTLIRKKQ